MNPGDRVLLETLEYGKLCLIPNGPVDGSGFRMLRQSPGFPMFVSGDWWEPDVHGSVAGEPARDFPPWDEPGFVLRTWAIRGSPWQVWSHEEVRLEEVDEGRQYSHERFLSFRPSPDGASVLGPATFFEIDQRHAIVAPDRTMVPEAPLLEGEVARLPSLSRQEEAFVEQALVWVLSGTPVTIVPSRPAGRPSADAFFRLAQAIWEALPQSLRVVFTVGYNVAGKAQIEGLSLSCSPDWSPIAATYNPETEGWQPPSKVRLGDREDVDFAHGWTASAREWLARCEGQPGAGQSLMPFMSGVPQGSGTDHALDLRDPSVRAWFRRPGDLAPDLTVLQAFGEYVAAGVDGAGRLVSVPDLGLVGQHVAVTVAARVLSESESEPERWSRAFRVLLRAAANQRVYPMVEALDSLSPPAQNLLGLLRSDPGDPARTAPTLRALQDLPSPLTRSVLQLLKEPGSLLKARFEAPLHGLVGPSLLDQHRALWADLRNAPSEPYASWLDSQIVALLGVHHLQAGSVGPELLAFVEEVVSSAPRLAVILAVERDLPPGWEQRQNLAQFTNDEGPDDLTLIANRFAERLYRTPADSVARAWLERLAAVQARSQRHFDRVLAGEFSRAPDETLAKQIRRYVAENNLTHTLTADQRHHLSAYVLRHWGEFLGTAWDMEVDALRPGWDLLVAKWPRHVQWALSPQRPAELSRPPLLEFTLPTWLDPTHLRELASGLCDRFAFGNPLPEGAAQLLFRLCTENRPQSDGPNRYLFLNTCVALAQRRLPADQPGANLDLWHSLQLAGTLAQLAGLRLEELWSVARTSVEVFVAVHAAPLPSARRGRVFRTLMEDTFIRDIENRQLLAALPEHARLMMEPMLAGFLEASHPEPDLLADVEGTVLAYAYRGLPAEAYPALTAEILGAFYREPNVVVALTRFLEGLPDQEARRHHGPQLVANWIVLWLQAGQMSPMHAHQLVVWWAQHRPRLHGEWKVVQRGSRALRRWVFAYNAWGVVMVLLMVVGVPFLFTWTVVSPLLSLMAVGLFVLIALPPMAVMLLWIDRLATNPDHPTIRLNVAERRDLELVWLIRQRGRLSIIVGLPLGNLLNVLVGAQREEPFVVHGTT